MPTHHPSRPGHTPGFSFSGVQGFLQRLLRHWQAGRQARCERTRQREELALMSAPELSDLGLSRAQLQFELSKQKNSGG